MIAAVLSVVLASTAAVAAPKPSAECVTYDGAYAQAPLMTVLGQTGSKVHLQDRALPCPQGSTCPWVRAGYVLPGDQVFVSAPLNGFRCVYMGARGRLTAGFLPDAALAVTASNDLITPAWLVGRWSDGNSLIVVSNKGGELVADGDAIWPGRNFNGPPGPNIGGFQGSARISGSTVTLSDGDCQVEARRRGPYLIVFDNANCGGMNVRFMGIYASGSPFKP